MSWVTWSPPRGRTAEWASLPSRKTATSVVPPPTSRRRTVIFSSSGFRTPRPLARGWATRASMKSPASSTARRRLERGPRAAAIRWTSTSRRTPAMPHGVPDPLLAVHLELQGQGVEELQLAVKGVGLGLLNGPLHVALGDAVPPSDGGQAVAGNALQVGTPHAHHHPLHPDPGHPFGLVDALADGLGGALQVDHHAPLQPLGGGGTFPR
jgi:hypothetical protein